MKSIDTYFQQQHEKYAPKKEDEPQIQIKGVDSSNIPPYKAVMRNKMIKLWKGASLPNPILVQPDGNLMAINRRTVSV
jgi:hypothetical protein